MDADFSAPMPPGLFNGTTFYTALILQSAETVFSADCAFGALCKIPF